MRLTARLVLVLTLGVIALVVIHGYLALRREADLFEREVNADAATMGDALEEIVPVAWRATGREAALALVREASERDHPMEIRWVWFDAQRGDDYSPWTSPDQRKGAVIEQRQPILARHPDDQMYVHVYWPIAVDESREGGLEFYESLSELDRRKQNVFYRTLLLVAGMVVVTGAFAFVLGTRVVSRPLAQLIEKTQRIGAGDLSGPLRLGSRDELGRLADSLNRMCEQLVEAQARIRQETAARIAAMEQLRHADRLRTVGRLAAGMAHELGTPLNVIAGRAGLVASGKLVQQEITDSAVAIKSEAEKMTRIIRKLLDFARHSTPRRTSADLRHVICRTIDLLAALAEKRGVRLTLLGDDGPCMASVDVGQAQQVLTNLIVNAIEAMPDGGKVEVDIRRERARPPEGHQGAQGPYYRIEVRDQGKGMSQETMEHLFEPFFTTKSVGEGTGLGLSISYGIVEEHGGWIDVASEPGKGTCFFIYLPAEPNP